ncbi:recombinase family protein [Rhizorhabdus histidinilytica]|uniref:recombinase family protein n=1 Tax=Rhizorhabdus histidinilytica TaxID=439228 RepID=UPI0032209310
MRPGESKVIRCAIYTRKSDEKGLEQEFNSLDAQREACEAYIASQRHEGWKLVPTAYDDGGLSGGTMDRPALQQLLADIKAGKVDCIVVYKIDRLTRSLADFARIVEVLDASSASFVSVTQAFNTTSSMGRLTLNVLLSFAQFEREVTSERIRDKIAASKARGMWMGGVPPLGYVVKDRKLVVVPEDAARVRMIFERYLELGSVLALAIDLEKRGIRSNPRIDRNGVQRGNAPFSRGALQLMLQNRIYRGEICHKGKAYPGEHEAIIDQALFDQVGALIARNRNNHVDGVHASEPSLLIGKVWDAFGRRMPPSHSTKPGRRYRYYVSDNRDARLKERRHRVPAGELEAIVITQLRKRLDAESGPTSLISLDTAPHSEQRRLVADSIERIVIHPDRIDISFIEQDGGPKHVSVAASLIRRGVETKLELPPEDRAVGERDPALIKLVAKAHIAREALMSAGDRSIADLAAEQGLSKDYFGVLLRISYLAPDIVAAILDGRQPVQLNRQRLARMTSLPIDWQQQREMLGFG